MHNRKAAKRIKEVEQAGLRLHVAAVSVFGAMLEANAEGLIDIRPMSFPYGIALHSLAKAIDDFDRVVPTGTEAEASNGKKLDGFRSILSELAKQNEIKRAKLLAILNNGGADCENDRPL